MNKIKVLLADDHKVFLDGLESVLALEPEFEIVGVATHDKQVMGILRSSTPNVMVLDISMPGVDGIEIAQQVLRQYPDVAILMLSFSAEASHIIKLREMGVQGYLIKSSDSSEVKKAIRTLANGQEFFSSEVLAIARAGRNKATITSPLQFTRKEEEVLDGLAEGWDNHKIADEMTVEMSTVETHLKNIRHKTEIGSARALVKFAIDNGYGNTRKKKTPSR
jgi:two-component system, NarL family, nitrate/nitrite response regulator NarL